jgi:PAS domain S-box-containing protein
MTSPDKPSPLRTAAEAQLIAMPALDTGVPLAELLHELQVHQIELEMQNEDLRQTQHALETSRDRYLDLYEFAPVGYLTLSAEGIIEAINLTGAKLLGVERRQLLRHRFVACVAHEDRDVWLRQFVSVRQHGAPHSVELDMLRGDGTVFQAQLDCAPQKVGACETAILIALADISERKQAETEIAQNRDRLASFAIEQNRAVEAERKRLAREVHDQIGQVFTAIKLIINSLPRETFPSGQEAALAQALDMGIATTRKITAQLRPPLLDDLGFASAVDHFSKETAKLGNLLIEIDIEAQAALDATQALMLFRVLQESFTNILRHASATHVAITGRRDGNRYIFCIEDDGCGFAPTDMRVGAMGLKNMRERALLLGGYCEASQRPQGGTSVTISLPLGGDASDAHPAA